MNKWKSIESAPRPGKKVLLTGGFSVDIGWYGDDGWVCLDNATADGLNRWIAGHGPTHWMPLPDPPR